MGEKGERRSTQGGCGRRTLEIETGCERGREGERNAQLESVQVRKSSVFLHVVDHMVCRRQSTLVHDHLHQIFFHPA